MIQSCQDYDPINYVKTPLSSDTWFHCGKPGHSIRNGPDDGGRHPGSVPRMKKCTGIPRSFLMEVEDPNTKGAMLTNTGKYVIPILNAEAYAREKKKKPPLLPVEPSSTSSDPVPEEQPPLTPPPPALVAFRPPAALQSLFSNCLHLFPRALLSNSNQQHQHRFSQAPKDNPCPQLLIPSKAGEGAQQVEEQAGNRKQRSPTLTNLQMSFMRNQWNMKRFQRRGNIKFAGVKVTNLAPGPEPMVIPVQDQGHPPTEDTVHGQGLPYLEATLTLNEQDLKGKERGIILTDMQKFQHTI
ncbi:uncharacterized protein [Phaenicophaeus curvirostris]|uniref:uncharacterized protein n=1 Tax=Phaenicophaeus curvirostris TaxID=33595 RepID=UPI0037F0DF3A